MTNSSSLWRPHHLASRARGIIPRNVRHIYTMARHHLFKARTYRDHAKARFGLQLPLFDEDDAEMGEAPDDRTLGWQAFTGGVSA